MLPAIVKKRIQRVSLVAVLLFSCVIAKLAHIQLIERDDLYLKALDLWERDFPISGLRGSILDANGNVLAMDIASTSVMVVPAQIDDKESTAAFLADVLQADLQQMIQDVSQQVSTQRINPEGKLISNEQAIEIATANLAGVYLVQDSLRYYPYGNYLAQVLGFTGADNQGLAGLEYQYNEILQANSGSMKIPFDAKGHPVTTYSERYVAPGIGMDVMLTIDSEIQMILEREANNAMLKYTPDALWAIAMNPNTGEILAMVSKPDFDPNHYQDYDATTYNYNLPIWMSYEPGSTFKTITFAAALEEDLFDMHEDTFLDTGSIEVEGARLSSWKAGGHGLQTYLQCLENSSNPCFVDIAQKLGEENLEKYLELFNLGQKTNVDLPGESSGILFSEENFGPLEQATTGFGQGISITSLQLVSAFSAIVNGGYYYQPYITKAVLHPTSKDVLFEVEPNMLRQVISNETSFEMRYALESVVANGGSRSSYIEGYQIGGKTGTAQKAQDGQYVVGEYILSYIGAAPIDDPEIVVYLALDSPNSPTQYGGTVAAPIVKAALEDILVYMDVEQVDTQLPKLTTWLDPVYISIQDYVGKNKNELSSSQVEFVFVGEGETVIAQLPEPGVEIEENGKVWLYLADN